MKASKHLREAIFATLQQTANDIEAQRQVTEYAFRKRIHETNQAKSELEWQQRNVSNFLNIYTYNHMIVTAASNLSINLQLYSLNLGVDTPDFFFA